MPHKLAGEKRESDRVFPSLSFRSSYEERTAALKEQLKRIEQGTTLPVVFQYGKWPWGLDWLNKSLPTIYAHAVRIPVPVCAYELRVTMDIIYTHARWYADKSCECS